MNKCITLEISLKPFYQTDAASIEAVCQRLFSQWDKLLANTESVAVLLWAADGSEILEYDGCLDTAFEWARYIGGAERRTNWNHTLDPEGLGLHTTHYLYRPDPPVMTYGILKQIVDTLRRVGAEMVGLPVRVGATFDPGPEFANSDFKYRRHNEICVGESMGRKSMVCCYALLHAEDRAYAGFPEGIPEGTPMGTFLGRQSQHFLTDLGFDYLWLSNGFGFGTETWGQTGALFDGRQFYPEKLETVRQQILEFWRLFRAECAYPIETRGTNLTAGIDYATDGVDHKAIYESVEDLLPPPNSPWAALDGDFGLELAGYMSRMAELPPHGKYLFRFYVHDPWWMNSPWIDRYEGQPHDIYLPLAISRLDENGKAAMPDNINFLTVDNSLGEMPDSCPREIIPPMLTSLETAPDAPAPFVWIYPFTRYTAADMPLSRPYFEDWFMVGMLNDGVPVSSVISEENLVNLRKQNPNFLRESVWVAPVPAADSENEKVYLAHVKAGGTVLLYGSVANAGDKLLNALGLQRTSEETGMFALSFNGPDRFIDNAPPLCVEFDGLHTDGGLDATLAPDTAADDVVASVVTQKGETRVLAICRSLEQGKLLWTRGAACWRGMNTAQVYPAQKMVRALLQKIGFEIFFDLPDAETKMPVLGLHRYENGWWYSGYTPNTAVAYHLKTPLGAPLLLGQETMLKDGVAEYHFPRAWRRECRVFVEQESGVVGCKETASISCQKRRRLIVSGLENATVRILPRAGFEEKTDLLLNTRYPYFISDDFTVEREESPWGTVLCIRNITGDLLISDIDPIGTDPIR